MVKDIGYYRRFIFIAIMIIALGITFSTTLKDTVGSFGNVLIAWWSFLY